MKNLKNWDLGRSIIYLSLRIPYMKWAYSIIGNSKFGITLHVTLNCPEILNHLNDSYPTLKIVF